jgi:DNA gyrase subunit B
VFLPDAEISYDELVTRVQQSAFLVPGLRITLTDDRNDEPVTETFQASGGIVDFVDHLALDTAVTPTWRLTGSGTFTEQIQVLDDQGQLVPTETERVCEVDIALRWGIGYETDVRSFVNVIATPKGGTHQAGFDLGLLRTVRKTIEANARRLKISAKDIAEERLEKDDVLAGLTAVITVRLAEPEFEGQTKEVLGTSAVRTIVAKVVDTELGAIFTSGKRDHKSGTNALLDKVVGEMRARLAARKQKEISRRKNALETSSLPARLADCRSDDIDHSELFIVEGESALGQPNSPASRTTRRCCRSAAKS